jgi:hypothetical protein
MLIYNNVISIVTKILYIYIRYGIFYYFHISRVSRVCVCDHVFGDGMVAQSTINSQNIIIIQRSLR